ncbi:MAG: rhomboid family intramembrane serine protease [Salibacteraceae bacterium]
MAEIQTFPVTYLLLAFTIGTSWLALRNRSIQIKLMYSPNQILRYGQWERLIGHPFIHADWMHLAFNMYMLYNFGKLVELKLNMDFPNWGGLYYLSLYLGGALIASVPALIRHHDNRSYFSLGASGAVSAVIFAMVVMMPTLELSLLFIPFGAMPGWLLGLGYIALEIYQDRRKRPGDNIAHDAHYWGAIAGILFVPLVRWEYIPEFIFAVQLWWQT